MTLWVTGGNGFIGRHLIRLLADQGRSVHGIGFGAIDEAERDRLGLSEWVNGEIDAPNLTALAERSGAPSTIFHLAGGSSVGFSIGQPYEDFVRTVGSAAHLLDWMRSSVPNCKMVVASSAAVYGAHYSGPIPEDAEPWPISPYGHHKLMMEQLCRSYAVSFGLSTTAVRFFSVYGLSLRKQLLWDICSRLQRGERELVLGGTGSEVRDWVDVRDAVRLLVAVAEQPQQETFEVLNGGCGVGTTVAEIAAMLIRSWGDQVGVRFSGSIRSGDPFSLVADDEKVRAMSFRWEIPLSRGIADYVNWFRGQAP